MGRPLFSLQSSAAPAVREEPEPTPVRCEKWSHWNSFDPDSDEFFENEDAVYEAFIDPVDDDIAPRLGEPGEDIMVIRRDGTLAPVDDNVNDQVMERGSPMAVGPDDPERMIVDAYFRDRVDPNGQELMGTGFRDFELSPDYLANLRLMVDAGLGSPEPVGIATPRRRSASISVPPRPHPSLRDTLATETFPRTSNIMPINVSNPRSRATDQPRTPIWGPSTPPSQAHAQPITPSPAPSVTPRLYSWSLGYSTAAPVSPSSNRNNNGPLTNAGARMSLAHIAPTLARARDIAA